MGARKSSPEREEKRLHLLDAAASEFARLGFDRANINTISELAGFGKGTVYLYTASKEDLFLEVLGEIGRTTTAALNEALHSSAGAPVDERLRALAHGFARLAAEHPSFVRLQASALFGVNRRFQEACAQVLRGIVTALASALAEEETRGTLRPVSHEVLAVWLLGTLQTFALLPEALRGADPTQRSSIPSWPETVADILWWGLRPETGETG